MNEEINTENTEMMPDGQSLAEDRAAQTPEPGRKTPLRRLAGFFSDAFSPLLSPTWAMVISLWLTPMLILPWGIRATTVLVIFFITAIVPGLSLLLLVRLGKISDTDVSDHRQRALPYGISIFCYLMAALFLYISKAPVWMMAFVLGAAVSAVIAAVISVFWKISAHATANAGIVGLICWLASHRALVMDQYAAVSIAVLVLGTVCWARLYLNKHTVLQVLAGSALGFAVIISSLSII